VTKQKSSENKTGTKSSAPAVKKNLTVETDNFGSTDKDKKKEEPLIENEDKEIDKKEKDDILDRDDFDEEEDDDDLARDDDQSPMTR